ncbi:MAG: hypothetical protein JO348_02530, partial [Alphaproteobacteria bacterium]|nr:hypothetical protein [Alphaproteobacteria bacterium]
ALCAMVLRALLPDGWMPAAGAATLTICSVEVQKSGDGKAPAVPGERSHAPCAFSAAVPFAPPVAADAFAAAAEAVRVAAVLVDDTVIPAHTYPSHAARAPPALS